MVDRKSKTLAISHCVPAVLFASISLSSVSAAAASQTYKIIVNVELPWTASDKPLTAMDDCKKPQSSSCIPVDDFVALSDPNILASLGAGARTTVPAGSINAKGLSLPDLGTHLYPDVPPPELYTEARDILAMSAQLFRRAGFKKPTQYDHKKWVSITAVLPFYAPLLLSINPALCDSVAESCTIRIPLHPCVRPRGSTACVQQPLKPNLAGAQAVLYTKADEVLALSERLYWDANPPK